MVRPRDGVVPEPGVAAAAASDGEAAGTDGDRVSRRVADDTDLGSAVNDRLIRISREPLRAKAGSGGVSRIS